METPASDLASFARLEERIAWLTLAVGAVAGAVVAVAYRPVWGAGIALGAGLAWLNFRWLKRGLAALADAAEAQANKEQVRVPIGTYFRMVFRYGLIGLAVYVIFEVLKVPVLSMIAGLCALGAATMLASVYEILRPTD